MSRLLPVQNTPDKAQVKQAHALLEPCLAQVGRVMLGKDHVIRQAVACLLAGGHLLIEDLPGMGKTVLAHALASSFGLSFARVQFTSDLLPADVLGVSIFRRESETFEFQPGPIFAQVVLADEINRSTPKTQSALLEAMEEGQVTSDGVSRVLPEPFFVIATQNPVFQSGTYPLPESQLDRFLFRISIGYPDAAAERQLLLGQDRRELLRSLQPRLNESELQQLRAVVQSVTVAESLLDYVQRLVHYTRTDPAFAWGLSPRAALALLAAARAWALLEGRGYVVPEDVQAIMPAVAGHRLRAIAEHGAGADGGALVAQALQAVDVVVG